MLRILGKIVRVKKILQVSMTPMVRVQMVLVFTVGVDSLTQVIRGQKVLVPTNLGWMWMEIYMGMQMSSLDSLGDARATGSDQPSTCLRGRRPSRPVRFGVGFA